MLVTSSSRKSLRNSKRHWAILFVKTLIIKLDESNKLVEKYLKKKKKNCLKLLGNIKSNWMYLDGFGC